MQTWVLYCSPACSKNDKERKQEREREHSTDRKWKRGKRRKIWKRQAEILNWNEKQKKSALQLIAETSPGSQEKGQILARGS